MVWALMLPLAHAETYQVKMLNSNHTGVMAFEPDYLHIQPGDTVHFVASDPTHNAMTIPGLWPEGAKTIRTPMSQDADVTFEQTGFYGIKCLPHFMLGMVMLIEVGEQTTEVNIPDNLPAMAKKRFGDIVQRAGQ